jgi:23S rRNA pseudouridine955/2504/2580 synthase
MREIQIEKNESGQRLDKFLQKYMKEASKGFLYKMLRKKNIKLNGGRAEGNEILAAGDFVTLYLAEDTLAKFRGELTGQQYPVTELDILYEDKDVVLINKPSGMLSQKAKKEDISLVEYYLGYLQSRGEWCPGGTFTPGICNRLDRNTSGIVIAGKSLHGLQMMSELLKKRTLEKYYFTIVEGVMKEPSVIQGFLLKDEKINKVHVFSEDGENRSYIETGYEPLENNGSYTLLKVKLITGKTHQIRSHLGSIGHPVLGDVKYGGRRYPGLKYFLLHAGEIDFPVIPESFGGISEKKFVAPLPSKFKKIKNELFADYRKEWLVK